MKGAYPAKILFFAFYYYFFFWGGGGGGGGGVGGGRADFKPLLILIIDLIHKRGPFL